MKFTFYWLDGTKETLEGNDAADALNRAGYGAGAVRALDFHSKGDGSNDGYEWNPKTHSWRRDEECVV